MKSALRFGARDAETEGQEARRPMLTRRDFIAASGAAAMAVTPARSAAAFPQKNISFIIPYGPGGGFDSFARAVAPAMQTYLPRRVYVVPNISVTFEMTGFKLPEELIKNTTAHYLDWDLYGTVNFTNRVGAQVGYRSLDVGYVDNNDNGAFKEKGLYFGVVARY